MPLKGATIWFPFFKQEYIDMELFLFSIVIASLKSPELAIPPLTGLVVNAHVLVSHKRFVNLKINTKFKVKADFFCIADIKVL